MKRKDHPGWRGHGGLSGSLYSDMKRKAAKRKIKFNVSVKYLWDLFEKQKGKCALSGVKIELPKGSSNHNRHHTASLDRINSDKGYIKGNCQWLFKTVNIMKWHYPQKEFVQFCKKIAKNN